jgi:hypothetical protein
MANVLERTKPKARRRERAAEHPDAVLRIGILVTLPMKGLARPTEPVANCDRCARALRLVHPDLVAICDNVALRNSYPIEAECPEEMYFLATTTRRSATP